MSEIGDALEAAVKKFEQRSKTIRLSALLALTIMAIVFLGGLIPLLRATDGTSGRSLAIYVLLILFGSMGIAFAKLWFAMMVNHITVMKELQIVQLRLLTPRDASG